MKPGPPAKLDLLVELALLVLLVILVKPALLVQPVQRVLLEPLVQLVLPV